MVLLLLCLLAPATAAAAERSRIPDPPWLRPAQAPGGNANFRGRPEAPAQAGKLKVKRAPQAATGALYPEEPEPGWCGDGICRGSEGESSSTCPDDCGGAPPPPPPLPCTGMDVKSLNETDNRDEVGPSPMSGGACDCVIRIDTTRRSVTGTDLIQECRGHYGESEHGRCPANCSDAGLHSAGTGRWGVELMSAGASGAIAPSVQPNSFSVVQDWRQWPSSDTARGFVWNSCTCDTVHFPAANPVSTGTARAAWYSVTSSAPTCAALATNPTMTASFELGLYELDPGTVGGGEDDLIARFSRNVAVNLSCDGAQGVCIGRASVAFANASGTVTADGVVEIECRSDPFQTCQSECGSTRECGMDRCGNDCGGCPWGEVCNGGVCESTCTPCLGQECGWDLNCNSGVWCGSCPWPQECDFGTCWESCTPCLGQTCGFDLNCNSGTWCGNCNPPYECNHFGRCEDTSVCVIECADGICCSSETDPWGGVYCPYDCGGGGGGGGGGDGDGGGGCSCDCDRDGWVTEEECVSGCGGRVDGGYCVLQ